MRRWNPPYQTSKSMVRLSKWVVVSFIDNYLPFDPQRTIVLPDDRVPFIHGDKPVPRVHGQHGEPHAEIRSQDPVPAEALDLLVIGAGVSNSFHGSKDTKNATVL